ncbi:MAG: hypothetical protein QOI41_2628 [Myxococcales bacterium]|nr:hypothetical protein [Myxococcales bacterium]
MSSGSTRASRSPKMAAMSLSSARLRYLSAMGAVVPSLMLAACKDPAQPPGGTGSTSTSTPATATVTPMATPSASTSVLATADQPPPDATAPDAAALIPRLPSCPSGDFCVSEATKGASNEKAPAPYAKCAAVPVDPDDAKDSGYRPRRFVRFSAENTAAARAKTANACCYTWVIPCPGGRAFRDATGTPSVARVIERTDWVLAIADLALADIAPAERAALADHWTQEAAFEHASIASFAQLTLDLLSVGAPPDLLESAQRATLDEIEHAKITFALATAYGGRPVGPAALSALPGASRTLAAIARSTFIDACVGESVASASLAESSRRASDPVLRDLLAKMADDEERHAELAWRIVAWCSSSGDLEVARALNEAKDEVTNELVSLTHRGDAVAPTEPADELRATVLREVVLPCTVALLGHLMTGRQTVSMQSSLASH